MPEVTGDVILPDEIYSIGFIKPRRSRTDYIIEQRFSGDPVSEVFRAYESGRIDRNGVYTERLSRLPAYGFDVFACKSADTGSVNEDRLRLYSPLSPVNSSEEFFLRAVYDVQFIQVGSKTHPVQGRIVIRPHIR